MLSNSAVATTTHIIFTAETKQFTIEGKEASKDNITFTFE